MAGQCNATFDELARSLGNFTCRNAPPIVHLRNPFALSNWTLPVLELMMVTGAVLALMFAIRRLRRDNDPTNLALWFATVVYLFVVEIPLYFPNIFGVEDKLGVVFAHNAFTVQFLFERLPLYIIALYPAVTSLAYEIVRSMGVFRDRGIVIGAICVGFVNQCFYEVFDQLGPQLRWWAWNTNNPLNHPMFDSVPLTSVFIFAVLGPIVCTILVKLLVGRKADTGTPFSRLSLAWRTVAAGALVPFGVGVLSLPSSIFGGEHPNITAQAIVLTIGLVIVAVIGLPVLIRQWTLLRGVDALATPPNEFVRVFGPLYLVVLGFLWASALPAYFEATDGITADGTPTGNLLYAAACFVFATLAVAGVATAGSPKRSVEVNEFALPAQ
jgi:hypothetical protein